MASPYIYERQSEYWISGQIENFFADAGFEVLTFPLTQFRESLIPADYLFFDQRHTKLFGFQYKALYRNAEDFWPIDPKQHVKLRPYPWIYYGLSELKRVKDRRVALHMTRFVTTNFEQCSRLRPHHMETYTRWGAFYQGLESCTQGIRIMSKQHFLSLFQPEGERQLHRELSTLCVDTFLTDFDNQRAVHLSPFLKPLPANEEREESRGESPQPSAGNLDLY